MFSVRHFKALLNVPFEKTVLPLVNVGDGAYPKGISCLAMNDKDKPKIRCFMRETFYEKAIVPKALRLLEYAPTVVEQELGRVIDRLSTQIYQCNAFSSQICT